MTMQFSNSTHHHGSLTPKRSDDDVRVGWSPLKGSGWGAGMASLDSGELFCSRRRDRVLYFIGDETKDSSCLRLRLNLISFFLLPPISLIYFGLALWFCTFCLEDLESHSELLQNHTRAPEWDGSWELRQPRVSPPLMLPMSRPISTKYIKVDLWGSVEVDNRYRRSGISLEARGASNSKFT